MVTNHICMAKKLWENARGILNSTEIQIIVNLTVIHIEIFVFCQQRFAISYRIKVFCCFYQYKADWFERSNHAMDVFYVIHSPVGGDKRLSFLSESWIFLSTNLFKSTVLFINVTVFISKSFSRCRCCSKCS